jgi:quinol monooxygenase YgiN
MYVITVNFTIKSGHVEAFRSAMESQARASLESEPGCHQFDVAIDPNDPTKVFLYELYSDKAAFEVHLETPHYSEFDAKTAAWLRSKSVYRYERIWPSD